MRPDSNNPENQLVALLWNYAGSDIELKSGNGNHVQVINPGRLAESFPQRIEGVKLSIDGELVVGNVVINSCDIFDNDNVIAQVVSKPMPKIYDLQGELIIQLTIEIDPALRDFSYTLMRLSRGSSCPCADFMLKLDPYYYDQHLNALLSERLETKVKEVKEFHDSSLGNWNQTLMMIFFRAMGSPKNKKPFVKLAKELPYELLMRNRASIETLEALLYGTSGLLTIRTDRYGHIKTLREEFEHLQNKHKITPLKVGEWNSNSGDFYGTPVVRLMQTAAFLHDKDFSMDSVVNITSIDDVYKLMQAQISDNWRDYAEMPTHIGKDRQDVLAINFIVPLLFAYGQIMDIEPILEQAFELLYAIAPERNHIINSWRKAGLEPKHSGDTQALIQLTNEYCKKGKCLECRLGREQFKQKVACLSK